MREIQKILIVAALSGASFIAGCGSSDEAAGTPDSVNASDSTTEENRQALELSAELANELQKNLGKRLMGALKNGGPTEAIGVCQMMAQDITAATARTDPPVKVRRTALRVRNPQNRPDALDQKVLQTWQAGLHNGEIPEPVLSHENGQRIVHRPIMTAELCLQCHGSPAQIDPATRAALDALYPNDAATGFATGSLRGAFRISFEPQTGSPSE